MMTFLPAAIVLEGFGLMGVEPRDAAAFQRGAQAGIHRGGNVGERAFGGGLMVNGADRGIGLLVSGRKRATTASSDGFEATCQFLGEFGESEREIHELRFRLFFATLQRKDGSTRADAAEPRP